MKTLKALAVFLFVFGSWRAHSAEPNWEWVRLFGGGEEDRGTGVSVDSNDNVVFGGSSYFGAIGSQPANSLALVWGRIDPAGNISQASVAGMYPLDWGAVFTGVSFAKGIGGKTFINGRFYGSMNFGSAAFTSSYSGSFIGALDSELSVLWLKQIGVVTSDAQIGPPAVDSGNNVFSSSSFRTANYDGILLGSSGQTYDTDILALAVNENGEASWMKKAGGEGNDTAMAAAVDPQGGLYSAGAFGSRPVIFGTNIINATNSGFSGFVSKRNTSGDIQWVKLLGNATKALAGHPLGGVVVGGIDNVIGEPWLDEVQGVGFLSRLNAQGDVIWQKSLPQVRFESIVVLPNAEFYAAGLLRGSTTIDGKIFTSRGQGDVFLGRFKPDGTLVWGKTGGGIYHDWARQIAVGSNGVVYVCGTLRDGGIFGTLPVEGRGKGDGFIAKFLDPSGSQLPQITTQPQSASAYFGGTASFTVASTDPLVSYQWLFNNVPIAGQTNATLRIESAKLSQDGFYSVEVRNEYGAIRSEAVRLLVVGDAPVIVTTVAGTNVAGYVDSLNPKNVRFRSPNSFALLPNGSVLIPDTENHVIRIMEPSGAVATYAGKGLPGFTNDVGSSAYFNSPIGVAADAAWDLYVADAGNHVVRKINAFGTRAVSTFAGHGIVGLTNGSATQARFNFPNDLVVDPYGNLFVTEFYNHTVRKIAPDGTVSTFAGTGIAGHKDGPGGQAQFNSPGGIARDSVGNFYVTDWSNRVIRKITPDGIVSTIAGAVRQFGFVDGPAATARLFGPDGIAVDGKGNIFFTEHWNNSVRRIDPSGEVLTLVGTAGEGFADGGKAEAKMLHPGGIAVLPDGTLLVADTGNHAIRKITWQTNAVPTQAAVLIELNPAITVFGIAGKTYRIEVTENLLTTQWTVLGEVTLESPVETWFDSQPATRTQRYYRAVLKE